MMNKLKRWLSGEADWKAEQELDQLGNKDAFLADAMEGYRSMPEADHSKAVADLKGKLKTNYTGKGNGISWTGLAASAAAIALVLSVFIWTQRTVKGPEEIAEVRTTAPSKKQEKITEPERLEDLTASADEVEAVKEEIVDVSETEPEEEPVVAFNGSNRRAKVDPSNIEAGIINEDDLAEMDDEAVVAYGETEKDKQNDFTSLDTVSIDLEDASSLAMEAVSDEKVPEATEDVTIRGSREGATNTDVVLEQKRLRSEGEKKTTTSAASSTVSPSIAANVDKESPLALVGKVIDADSGEPIPFANVYIKSSANGTTTDVDGNFTLASNEELPWLLVVNYVGYMEEEIAISRLTKDFVVEMSTDGVALDEVAVTGFSKRKKNKADKQAVKTPKPRVGFRKMKRYIRKNMKYPPIAKQNKIQGGVTIRFFINAEGKPEEFKILNSLGSGCDKEAERLLEEGPKWEPTGVWAIYTVVFNL